MVTSLCVLVRVLDDGIAGENVPTPERLELANLTGSALVLHMLEAMGEEPGVHVFCTHDLLIVATIARLYARPLPKDEWPWFLEGAFFWNNDIGVQVAYRGHEWVGDID